ncbi:VOC family protein [Rhizobium sp. LC145]|uniref:bleomycin resistance protein n=1 Tax=Rhizobium sp. LC145 TaxID=1120688 RepID=UPI00062A311D|nr:VOC family protein [Rhizobium sp. LC145]KKX28306.1 glyoxalase [Rhizobium sp. LC145]TKT58370.1 VOC family protein [Rhizobiaceae bacterium LC148]
MIPELSVSDWRASRDFYCDLIGFSVRYDRPEEGFAFLTLGEAQLMIDQIGIGRDFDMPGAPRERPFGRGVNLQIRVSALEPILARLQLAGIPLYLEPEEKWYRRDDLEVGNRQFIVADPDGYLLRLFEDLGER